MAMAPGLQLGALLWSLDTSFTSLLGCVKSSQPHKNVHLTTIHLFACLLASPAASAPNLGIILDSSASLNTYINSSTTVI